MVASGSSWALQQWSPCRSDVRVKGLPTLLDDMGIEDTNWCLDEEVHEPAMLCRYYSMYPIRSSIGSTMWVKHCFL